MESDECGGLPIFTKEYPEATVLCSALCARELPGYGFTGKIKVCSENEVLEDGTLKLHFQLSIRGAFAKWLNML